MDATVTWLMSLIPQLDHPTALLIVQVVYAAILSFAAPIVLVVGLTWMERKVAARIQNRIGPNRAGPFGWFQGFADAIKMFTKEDITPTGADRIVYNLAPALAAIGAVLVFAVIPMAPGVIGIDLNIGILYVVAIGAIGTLATIMGGWSSNNKFALVSAFRIVAQLIAYEVPMVIAIITVVLAAGSMQMGQIIAAQDLPFAVTMPVAFLIFLLAGMAEIGRAPFDLTEAESEIVAGFHVEYSGMKFAFFFIGEYMHLFAASAIGVTLFLGGWRGPFAGPDSIIGVILGFAYFVIKTTVLIWVMMWIRGTLFRIRIDHLLDFSWKFLVPVGLFLVVAVAVVIKLPIISGSTLRWLGLLGANGVVAAVALWTVAAAARRSRSAALRGITGVAGE
jgi:NADH-quinone oxidoreductase subunit H